MSFHRVQAICMRHICGHEVPKYNKTYNNAQNFPVKTSSGRACMHTIVALYLSLCFKRFTFVILN